jgi:hypothetical protein
LRSNNIGEMNLDYHSPICVTVVQLHDKFEIDGTVQNVSKGCCGRSHSSAVGGIVETVTQAFTHSTRKSVR